MLLAIERGQAGDFEAASSTVLDSVSRRARSLGVSVPAVPVTLRALTTAVQLVPVDFENDEDWLFDMFEICLRGPHPSIPDSNGNGTLDIDEDEDGDGLPDGLVYGVTHDPSRVVVHFGDVDPRLESFWQQGPLEAGPAGTSASGWRIESNGEGLYGIPLTSSQQRAAEPQGWRLLTRVSVERGSAIVVLSPRGDRETFELRVTRVDGDRVLVEANGVPVEAPTAGAGPLLVELRFDAARHMTRLSTAGRLGSTTVPSGTADPHPWGLRFGVRGSRDAAAAAIFHTVLYEIRF